MKVKITLSGAKINRGKVYKIIYSNRITGIVNSTKFTQLNYSAQSNMQCITNNLWKNHQAQGKL